MHVATPTRDCLELIHDLLAPVLQANADDALTRQEVRRERRERTSLAGFHSLVVC